MLDGISKEGLKHHMCVNSNRCTQSWKKRNALLVYGSSHGYNVSGDTASSRADEREEDQESHSRKSTKILNFSFPSHNLIDSIVFAKCSQI